MDKSKRNLTKALGVTGVGVGVWQKPAVDSVILPIHAATSDCGMRWISGDSTGGDETQLEGFFTSRCDCETAVMQQFPGASGATWGVPTGDSFGDCYAEFNWACPEDNSDDWDTKPFADIDCF